MSRIRILLVENIHTVAKTRLLEAGFEVELLGHSPAQKELNSLLKNFDVLGIRSKTEIQKTLLEENRHLLAVGAFCIGTNQVDLVTANNLGIPVFNAPHSNTRSVAELVIAEMIALSRQLCDRSSMAHKGEWIKSAEGSKEIRGKTLGIVGYGHIGSQVSVLAEALGMKVVFYDVVKKLNLGNAQSASSLDELLKNSDFVTLHVPQTPQTDQMITANELAKMKKGAFLLNASRGSVVCIEDLAKALSSGDLAGAAIDVFPVEPASNKEKFASSLQGLSNVILTPHIGGSTEEAQYNIGVEVAESFIRFLKIGSTSGAVEFPQVELPSTKNVKRIINVHQNQPGILGEINQVVSQAGANITSQYLSTDAKIGYLVMDFENVDADPLVEQIQKLKRSIRTRTVY
jgi:D-3-phosphoglycerate dehydrogenase